jgi:heme exporter protein A
MSRAMGTRQAAQPSIRLENAAIERGGRMVLRSFSLQADAGEIIWIRGANGSGKSTLLRTIAGLLALSVGILSADGSIALTDEGIALDDPASLEDGLRFWARLDGASNAQLEKALEALDLVPLAELPVRMLSAGQRRRGSLARMIASGAQIWLLDEPYNGLDQASVARLDATILQHSSSGGIALIASHIAPTVNVARSVVLDQAARKTAA